jgi:hypothetical protein
MYLIPRQPYRCLIALGERHITPPAAETDKVVALHVSGKPSLPYAGERRLTEVSHNGASKSGFFPQFAEGRFTGGLSRIHLAAGDAPDTRQEPFVLAAPHD